MYVLFGSNRLLLPNNTYIHTIKVKMQHTSVTLQ